MSPRARLMPLVLATVVVSVSLCWVTGFTLSVGGLPNDPSASYVVMVAVVGTVVAVPWAVAVRMLWRHWSQPAVGSDQSAEGPDGPARLLTLAVSTLPIDRRSWGSAMTAELGQLSRPPDRWRFALGCVRAVIFVPRRLPLSLLWLCPLVAAVAIGVGLVTGTAAPGMRVLAVAVVLLSGAIAVVSVSRGGRAARSRPGTTLTAVGLLGVAACLAAVGYFLIEYPVAASHLPPTAAVVMALLLCGCAWLVIRPPTAMIPGRFVGGIALAAAVASSAGLLFVSRRSISEGVDLGAGILGYLYLVPTAIICATAGIAALAGRSFHAGVQAAVWSSLLTSLGLFVVALVEAVQWYRFDTRLILAGDGVPLSAVGENLRNFGWGLILLPVWWLPYGVIGAGVGGAVRRHLSRESRSPELQSPAPAPG